MTWLIATFLITAVVALALTALVRALARRWGVLDYPDGWRKLHQRLIPLWGGVAVYLAMVVGLFVARCGSFATGPAFDNVVWKLVWVAGFVCLVGGIDDYKHLRPRMKLLLQICAVAPLIALGGWVDRFSVFGTEVQLGWFGVPLTLFWLLGCINAVNLLDGMDGLATIVGLATASMIGLIAVNEGHPHVTLAAIALAGSLAGFLVYNLPPASIFLGDSGSLVIGLVVGLLGIEASMKTATTLAVTAPAVIMTLPMLDVVLAVIRRRLTGRAIDSADRQHIHHRLLDRGLSNWQVLCILGAMCALTGAAATTASFFRSDILAWVMTLSLVVLVIRLRLFGHHEFILVEQAFAGVLATLAGRLFAGLRSDPPAPAELQGSSWEDVWAMLIDEVRAWRVRRLEFIIAAPDGGKRHWTWYHTAASEHGAYAWSVSVAFRTPQALDCQLRASLADAAGPASLYLSGLARLLRAYGQYMAGHAPEKPLLSVLHPSNDGEAAAGSDAEISASAESLASDPHAKEEAA